MKRPFEKIHCSGQKERADLKKKAAIERFRCEISIIREKKRQVGWTTSKLRRTMSKANKKQKRGRKIERWGMFEQQSKHVVCLLSIVSS